MRRSSKIAHDPRDDELRSNDALTELKLTNSDLDVANKERVCCCVEVSSFFDLAVSVKCAMELSRVGTSASSAAVDICRGVLEERLLVILTDHNRVSVFCSVCVALTFVEASIRNVGSCWYVV